MTVVLDSSAVLAALFKELGNEVVKDAFDDEPGRVLISAVNIAEVFGKLVDRGMTDDQVAQTIAFLPIRSVGFTPDDGLIAGSIRRNTKRFGLSLGDRACLSLAMRMNARILTSDREWSKIPADEIGGVEIELIR